MSSRAIERATSFAGGLVVSENIVSWGGVNVSPAAAKTDGKSNATVVPEFGAMAQFFNGTTWDRARSGLIVVTASSIGMQNILPMGVFNTVAPTVPNGQTVPFQVDASGNLKVTGTFSDASIGLTGAAVPGSATYGGFLDAAGLLRAGRVFDLDTGGGTEFDLGVNLRLSAGGGSVEAQGQKTMATSIPVVLPSDQTIVVVNQSSATAAQSSVAAAAANTSLLASNAARLGATVFNDSATATLYLKLGTLSSLTSYTVQLMPGAYYELPFKWVGAVTGTWDTASGNARITELTA